MRLIPYRFSIHLMHTLPQYVFSRSRIGPRLSLHVIDRKFFQKCYSQYPSTKCRVSQKKSKAGVQRAASPLPECEVSSPILLSQGGGEKGFLNRPGTKC